ncbi:MAG: hypothetical protein DWQ06_06325 [Calditrichaeota bacterium]|nr:MAG: hypothetical protein DWQ06_06325 [Calditrichota bacterium]
MFTKKFLTLFLITSSISIAVGDDYLISTLSPKKEDDFKSDYFSLSDSATLKIQGTGRTRSDKLIFYGWIFNRDSKKLSWIMNEKNRSSKLRNNTFKYEETIKFPPGNYKVCFNTFGKYSYWVDPNDFDFSYNFKFNKHDHGDFDFDGKSMEEIEEHFEDLEEKLEEMNENLEEIEENFDEDKFNNENDDLSNIWKIDDYLESIIHKLKGLKEDIIEEKKYRKKYHNDYQISVSIDEEFEDLVVDHYDFKPKDFTFVNFTQVGNNARLEKGFTVKEPTQLNIYAIGEILQDVRADFAWIVNYDTRDYVWQMKKSTTTPFGGSSKNRGFKGFISLPKGNYVAYFSSDDSHSTDSWNTNPPYDTDNWGITISVKSEKKDLISDFNINQKKPILDITKVGDDEFITRGFSLKKPTELWIYAIGEISYGEHDFAYIQRADIRETVWKMKKSNTVSAGGADKNRIFDGLIALDKGDYLVNYVSDGSHSYGNGWNDTQPSDPTSWGIKIYTVGEIEEDSDIEIFSEYEPANTIARITKVRDDAYVQTEFIVKEETSVRVYAIGEGQSGEMYDYGWIENANGLRIWSMEYKETSWAGGARKNRSINETITLPAGSYTLFYKSDDSHSYRDWNASPPDDPNSWGISVASMKK